MIILIIDGFIIHNPFIEEYEIKSMEIKHLLLNMMIVFSLMMIVGMR